MYNKLIIINIIYNNYTFQARSIKGKFHGTIAATTPTEDQPLISVSINCAQPRNKSQYLRY